MLKLIGLNDSAYEDWNEGITLLGVHSMPKVSVIMPSLNVVNYIEQAVKSVIDQTLSDIEILCVDAGSNDGTLEILQDFADEDSRVRIIMSDKKSYGYQMNLGVSQATGEYIGIVETDDYIKADMYERLYEIAVNNDLDFVKSDYYKFWQVHKHEVYMQVAPGEEDYNRLIDGSRREDFFRYSSLNWTGIYKRSYLVDNNICHSETPGASYQDIGFWLLNMSMAKRAMWIPEAFYMYRQDNPASSMKNREKMLCSAYEYDRVLEILRSNKLDVAYRECLLLKQSDYRVTFSRIDDGLKRTYLDEVLRMHTKEKEEIECYSLSEAQTNSIQWIENAINYADEVCDDLVHNNSAIRARLEAADEIYVYGAGQVAKRMFEHLYALGYWDKVISVVTTSAMTEEQFCGKEVKLWEKVYSDISQDALIIVAVGKLLMSEVINTITTSSISNVLEPSEIDDLVYTI